MVSFSTQSFKQRPHGFNNLDHSYLKTKLISPTGGKIDSFWVSSLIFRVFCKEKLKGHVCDRWMLLGNEFQGIDLMDSMGTLGDLGLH